MAFVFGTFATNRAALNSGPGVGSSLSSPPRVFLMFAASCSLPSHGITAVRYGGGLPSPAAFAVFNLVHFRDCWPVGVSSLLFKLVSSFHIFCPVRPLYAPFCAPLCTIRAPLAPLLLVCRPTCRLVFHFGWINFLPRVTAFLPAFLPHP